MLLSTLSTHCQRLTPPATLLSIRVTAFCQRVNAFFRSGFSENSRFYRNFGFRGAEKCFFVDSSTYSYVFTGLILSTGLLTLLTVVVNILVSYLFIVTYYYLSNGPVLLTLLTIGIHRGGLSQ